VGRFVYSRPPFHLPFILPHTMQNSTRLAPMPRAYRILPTILHLTPAAHNLRTAADAATPVRRAARNRLPAYATRTSLYHMATFYAAPQPAHHPLSWLLRSPFDSL